MNEHTGTILAFLRGIGLEVAAADLPEGTDFLPGLALRGGVLAYDPVRLRHPGDLLHEAGHLALLRPEDRACGAEDGLLDDPAVEVAAIAWSFAALVHLGLPLEVVFHAEGYRGRSQALVRSYTLGVYPGVPELEAAGLAAGPAKASELGVAAYPAMIRWLKG